MIDFTSCDTAKEQREVLANAGITGEALEVLVKAGANYRHRRRVVAVDNTIRNHADALLRRHIGITSNHYRNTLLLQAALMWAELVGIGSPSARQGMQTMRQRCFSALGKGRRHAVDGPAWDAAIAQALDDVLLNLGEHGSLTFTAEEDGRILTGFEATRLHTGIDVQQLTLFDTTSATVFMDPEWLQSISLIAMGVRVVPMPVTAHMLGTGRQWADCYNSVTRYIANQDNWPGQQAFDVGVDVAVSGADADVADEEGASLTVSRRVITSEL